MKICSKGKEQIDCKGKLLMVIRDNQISVQKTTSAVELVQWTTSCLHQTQIALELE